jgi:hypothetical protein
MLRLNTRTKSSKKARSSSRHVDRRGRESARKLIAACDRSKAGKPLHQDVGVSLDRIPLSLATCGSAALIRVEALLLPYASEGRAASCRSCLGRKDRGVSPLRRQPVRLQTTPANTGQWLFAKADA